MFMEKIEASAILAGPRRPLALKLVVGFLFLVAAALVMVPWTFIVLLWTFIGLAARSGRSACDVVRFAGEAVVGR
jgi:hypothetical protein